MALIDRVHDISRVITTLDNKSDILRKEVQKMKAGGDPNAVAAAEQQASEAQFLVDHMKIELEELTEAREQLADSEDQLRDVKTQGRSTEVGHRGLQEVTRVRDGPGLNRPSFPRVWLLVSVGSVLGLIARRTFLRHRVFPSSAKNVVVLNAVVGESARLSSSPVRKLIHIVKATAAGSDNGEQRLRRRADSGREQQQRRVAGNDSGEWRCNRDSRVGLGLRKQLSMR
ncbi:hypothetical protein GW17_00007411 [Ensete ventricosum]|nr:hypothetical protein GW17_00007411 [Ensete ventricosum]